MKDKIGSKANPMVLKTPPVSSEYSMHVDEKDGKDCLAEVTHNAKGNKMRSI